ncbi:AmmeMemoRadiSam system protein B [Candidatus Bipolaricaulota bacterium]|nr:AmmeMemoRadiSam system protein B [Candidatus Bipolaricaulota bacterium]
MRRPAVAGSFYPASKEALTQELSRLLGERPRVGPGLLGPVGLIVPHAGYIYSGPVAAVGYRALAELGRPEAAVILGTNHTGLGGPITVPNTSEPWEIPLGEMPVEDGLWRDLAALPGVVRDDLPFLREHSIEVQLPFLYFIYGPLPFVPAVVSTTRREVIRPFGEGLADLLRGKSVAIIASTDFTHYEPHLVAKRKDEVALEHIRKLDLEGFLRVVRDLDISICGVGAVGILITVAAELGLQEVEVLGYATSGETSGFFEEVVGYAAVLFREGKG